MNQAIKINPNFSNAFLDRGVANGDFDRGLASTDIPAMAKPSFAVSFNGRGSAYENRREGDRIIQEANPPILNNQYDSYAYSPETFVPAPPAPVASLAPLHMPEPAVTQLPSADADPVIVPMPRPNPLRHRGPKIRQAQQYY